MKKRIAILGGGLAGLAAAVELVTQLADSKQNDHCCPDVNSEIVILEKRAALGGRTNSFRDPVTGLEMDNSPHVFLGCYHQTRRFLQRIGSEPLLRFQSRLTVPFLHPQRGKALLRVCGLPAPLHLLAALIGYRHLSWSQRCEVLHAGIAMHRLKGLNSESTWDKLTVSEWLHQQRQSLSTQQAFWNVLTLATLNNVPERVSFLQLLRVFKIGFLGGVEDSQLGLSTVSLQKLIGIPAGKFLQKHQVSIRLRCAVKKIETTWKSSHSGGQVQHLLLQSGEKLPVDWVISALPFSSLRRILPDGIEKNWPESRHLWNFTSEPIISVNLVFNRHITDLPFAALLQTHLAQWLFNRNLNWDSVPSEYHYLSVVISGAGEWIDWPNEAILQKVLDDLEKFFPVVKSVHLLRARVVKEREATLASLPGVESLRFPTVTPICNLFLAGDWTATGLPATMEGAVRSGVQCAQKLLEQYADGNS